MADEATLTNEIGFANDEIIVGEDDFLSGKEIVQDDSVSAKPADKGTMNSAPDAKNAPAQQGDQTQSAADKGGFVSRFTKQDDKGVAAFDAEAALNFITGDAKAQTPKYQPIQRKQEQQDQNAQKSQPPANPYRQRIEDRRKFSDGLRADLLMWRSQYSDAITKGYTPENALAMADRAVNDHIETKTADWEGEWEAKFAEERGRNDMSAKELADAKIAAYQNMQRMAQQLGGLAEYDAFMFGKNENGKSAPGYGYAKEWASLLFDIMNPDAKDGDRQSVQDWFHRFASDPGRLALLEKTAMALFFYDNRERFFQKAVAVNEESKRQQAMGVQRKPGQSAQSIAPANENMPGDLAGFLAPPGNREVDTI